MGVTTTPLGFQKPDGNDQLRNGDNVISANAAKSDELLLEARARIANLQAVGFSSGFDGGTPYDDFSRSFDGGNPTTQFTDDETTVDPLQLNDSAVAQALAGGMETPLALRDELADPLSPSRVALDGAYTTAGVFAGVEAELDTKVTIVSTFAELQTAVAAGGTVRVGSAPITITATLSVTAPTTILGGNFVLPADAAYPVFTVTSSNVRFDGCQFAGAGTGAAYSIDSRFIYAYGTLTAYLRDVHVTNCRMVGSQTENVRFVCVRDFSVTNNTMDDFLYAGVLLLSCEDGTAASNSITNAVMKSPVVNVYGIAATDSVNTEAGRSRRIKIIGNTVKNIPWEGIDTHGGDSIVIQGNTVVNCVRGIALVSGNETRLTVPTNCVVTGNFVDRGTATGTEREGISLFGLIANLASGVITGNIVKGFTAPNAIYTSQYDRLKTLVEGNSHPHVPWTALPLDNSAWTAHATYPPEYMVDGRTVYVRGFVTSTLTSTANTRIATLPLVAAPTRLTMPATSHGSNSASGVGTLGIYESGEFWMLYRTLGDLYSYPLGCSYQRNYTG